MYALYKEGYVDDNYEIVDDVRITYHNEENEVLAFAARHGYITDDYFICEVEDVYGDLCEIEGTRYNLSWITRSIL